VWITGASKEREQSFPVLPTSEGNISQTRGAAEDRQLLSHHVSINRERCDPMCRIMDHHPETLKVSSQSHGQEIRLVSSLSAGPAIAENPLLVFEPPPKGFLLSAVNETARPRCRGRHSHPPAESAAVGKR